MLTSVGMVIFITHKLNDNFFRETKFDWAFFIMVISLVFCAVACILFLVDFHILIHRPWPKWPEHSSGGVSTRQNPQDVADELYQAAAAAAAASPNRQK